MKSVKLVSPGKFDIIEEEFSQSLKANYALLKISSVGICGSDMHYFSEGRIGEQVVEYPYIIGHEAAGYIKEIKGDPQEFKVGELVAIDPAISCKECDQCKAGREHTCRNLLFMGAPGQLEGYMTEYVTVPLSNLYHVPSNFTPQETSFIEPLSIGVYAVELAKLINNERCAILGSGPIGISVLMTLLYEKVKDVIVTDKLDYRLKLASKLGAGVILNADDKEYAEKFPGEVDVVFECAGKQDALDFAVDILKPGGKLVIVGIPSEDKVYFDINTLRRKELQLINVRRQNNTMNKAIEIYKSFKKFSDDIITHNFAIEDTNKAFNLVHNYDDGVIKAIINFE